MTGGGSPESRCLAGTCDLTLANLPSQRVRQTIEYSYRSTHDGRVRLQDAAEFPLDIATNYTLLAKEHRFSAKLRSYGYNRQLLLPAALCDSHCGKDGSSAATKSSQSGEAEITGRDGQRSTGWGRMEERYSFVDSAGLVYREHVKGEPDLGESAESHETLPYSFDRDRVVCPSWSPFLEADERFSWIRSGEWDSYQAQSLAMAVVCARLRLSPRRIDCTSSCERVEVRGRGAASPEAERSGVSA